MGRANVLAQLKGVPRPRGERAAIPPSPGLYTAYTTYLHRDKALLRRLLKVPLGGAPGAGKLGSVCAGGAAGLLWLSPRPPGPAEEAAVGRADRSAEAAPLGAHAELPQPSGEARPAGRRGPGWRGRQQAVAQTPHSLPFPPRSTTWPASCPCRRASRPGRCGPGRGWEDGPYADPLGGGAGAPGASLFPPHLQVALTGKRNAGHMERGGVRGPLLWEGSPWDLSLQGGGWGTHKGCVCQVPWGGS